jgi:hypothetical protein
LGGAGEADGAGLGAGVDDAGLGACIGDEDVEVLEEGAPDGLDAPTPALTASSSAPFLSSGFETSAAFLATCAALNSAPVAALLSNLVPPAVVPTNSRFPVTEDIRVSSGFGAGRVAGGVVGAGVLVVVAAGVVGAGVLVVVAAGVDAGVEDAFLGGSEPRTSLGSNPLEDAVCQD